MIHLTILLLVPNLIYQSYIYLLLYVNIIKNNGKKLDTRTKKGYYYGMINVTYTAKNTLISPNFMVWKFCGKAQFLHSFGRFARNYAKTVPFHNTYLVYYRGKTTVMKHKIVHFTEKFKINVVNNLINEHVINFDSLNKNGDFIKEEEM